MRAPDPPAAPALGLDLGSTRLKAAPLSPDGRIGPVRSLPAPELRGNGEIREGDAEAYATVADELLRTVAAELPAGTLLGVASQRSTFLVWSNEAPLTPMISWQDRRATRWCARHARNGPEVTARTGLPLSAHYAGPKLASLIEGNPVLARALGEGEARFGTLESWLVWRWTGGRVHETDPTMAARTLMLDLDTNDWSDELLALYGVPRRCLPRVVPTTGRRHSLVGGLVLGATLADQASGALTVFDDRHGSVLVTLGTGAFVLRPVDRAGRLRPGYLLGPILGSAPGDWQFAIEGSINGAGPAVDRFGRGPTELPEVDRDPEAFALPDQNGLGAPHWRPELGLTFSAAGAALGRSARRRVVLEGILFRVREILDDLGLAPTERVILSGGLIRDPAVGRGLAALLGRPVELLSEREAGLLGAARLAAGLPPYADCPTTEVAPGPAGAYLGPKFPRWRDWLRSVLES